jgi:hypothetical protein
VALAVLSLITSTVAARGDSATLAPLSVLSSNVGGRDLVTLAGFGTAAAYTAALGEKSDAAS